MNTKERETNSRGRILWSKEDRKQLVDEYAKSGQAKKAFCLEYDINLGTFYGWFKRTKEKQKKKASESKPAFKEVRLPVAAGHAVEIVLPCEARVCLAGNGDQEELVKLIRGIAGC